VQTQPSIIIVICYIGRLPWYFDYFLHSCKFNTTVDFLIITDDRNYNKDLPPNVKFLYATIEEVNALATEKLGFQTAIYSPYKLCDFKPAYGLLFVEYLKDYDFWGHGDIDVIYGNIRNFITHDVLNGFDLIAVRDDFLTGYFLLFRNNEVMQRLFTNSRDYKKVFSSPRHFCFDETNFAFERFEQGDHFSTINSEVESMTHVVRRLAELNQIRAYFDFHVIEGAYGKLFWEQGKLMFKNKYEVLLYHLIKLKTIYQPTVLPKSVPNSFHISSTRIYQGKTRGNRKQAPMKDL
jgi:hypothetical protein